MSCHRSGPSERTSRALIGVATVCQHSDRTARPKARRSPRRGDAEETRSAASPRGHDGAKRIPWSEAMTGRIRRWGAPVALGLLAGTIAVAGRPGPAPADEAGTLTGKDALGDWTTDAPGVRRKITLADLATPY